MARLVLSVEVEAPVEQVWAAAVDWPRQGDWMALTRAWATEQDGHGVGAGITAFTGVGSIGFLDTMTITTWQPPHRCVVRHTGRVVRGSAAFEVEPLPGDRSRFVWSEWLVLPLGLVGELGFALLRPLIAWPIRCSLRRFARLAAAPHTSQSAADNARSPLSAADCETGGG